MSRDSLTAWAGVLGVVIGLVVLLYATYASMDAFVNVGGVITLVGMGVLTAFVAGLE